MATAGAPEPVGIRRNRRPATMADVAREVGLSHQTVSRVLNDHPLVRPDTRARVLKAIEDLGYRRNSAARALATRRSQTLGVISFNSTLYGPASTLFGIEQAAREAGFVVSVDSLTAITATTVREALDRLGKQAVEGIIVIAPLAGATEVLSAMAAELPTVVVEGGAAPGLGSVSVDQQEGARLVTRHLLDQGASTVWHVAGPADWVEAEGRVHGWRRELRRAGRAVRRPLRGTLEPVLRLRGGPAAGSAPRRRGGLRRQRPDGARAAPRVPRGRHPGAAGRPGRRVRRRAGGRVLHATADHRAAGLHRRSAGAASSSCWNRSSPVGRWSTRVVVPAGADGPAEQHAR